MNESGRVDASPILFTPEDRVAFLASLRETVTMPHMTTPCLTRSNTFRVGGRYRKSSRVALAMDGRDPGELFACHHCDNPPCCRADHLFPGTHRENMADMTAKGRHLINRPVLGRRPVFHAPMTSGHFVAGLLEAYRAEVALSLGVPASSVTDKALVARSPCKYRRDVWVATEAASRTTDAEREYEKVNGYPPSHLRLRESARDYWFK